MKTVYMCFSADIIHMGHIKIINKALELGELTVGVLSDEAVSTYKRYPLILQQERMDIMKSLAGVKKVVIQETLDYEMTLRALKPDYVVHGDDWRTGKQAKVRGKVLEVLDEIGGELIEYPYTESETVDKLEAHAKEKMYMPEVRRSRLKNLINMKQTVAAIEAHSGLTGLIAENTKVEKDGNTYQFDAMWISSLCDSTAKGKPDIELLDMSKRFDVIEEIMEVTTKPIILDADTGGMVEHFVFNIRTIERMGVSAVIIEDKVGAKKNSLFGTEVQQTQDTIEGFCNKIRAGKRALRTKDFMLIARIESLILEQGMEDAIARAKAYVEAGVDGIMIHSRQKTPDEILTFIKQFRAWDQTTPLVVVPTTFNSITHQQWKEYGVNIVIHANQLTRSAFPAMKKVAEVILENQRSLEADAMCMPIKEILTLIPDNI